MKKSLFSTLALFGMFGVGAITSHAEDTAEAVTNISANVISGGMEIETVNKVDFGDIEIGGSVSKTQDVKVTNLTGKPNIQLTVKRKAQSYQLFEDRWKWGATLQSMGAEGDNGKVVSTDEIPVVGVSRPTEIDGVSNYEFDWKLSIKEDYPYDRQQITGDLIFTASSTI